MVKARLIVRLDFLLHLQNVNALGEMFNLRTGNGIDKASLTNSIATNETVPFTTHEFKQCHVEEHLTANNQSHLVERNVSAEGVPAVVTHLGGWNLVLVGIELGEFLVNNLVLLGFDFGVLFGELCFVCSVVVS
jgi:hypothetical protein